jgi:NAD(P)-dependent dehydrogenase (short-subunit alcohol dehydrogenase family)
MADPSRLLDGRAALITGAASGIGRAAAHLFTQAGAVVVLSDRSEGVEAVAAEVRASGGRAIALVGDAGREADVIAAIERTTAEYGRLDAVFANAGIGGTLRPLLDQDVEEWTEVLRVNLIGVFLAVKHASRVMKAAGGGSIVCTASVAGIASGAGPVPYSASKAGVISLVKTAAADLGGTNVRVNAICPGLIETNMTKMWFDAARAKGTVDRIGQLNALRRHGAPEEIASVAVFLASDAASYVNGQAIAVDGGLTSSLPVMPPRPPRPEGAQ